MSFCVPVCSPVIPNQREFDPLEPLEWPWCSVCPYVSGHSHSQTVGRSNPHYLLSLFQSTIVSPKLLWEFPNSLFEITIVSSNYFWGFQTHSLRSLLFPQFFSWGFQTHSLRSLLFPQITFGVSKLTL